jgi:glycolate oxidase iron-sulfur subunit
MATTADTPRTPLPLTPATTRLGQNIDYELFMDCVHCGLCLGSCPTYVETGNENDSPRGRIYLWRAVADGRLQLDADVRYHLDLCLECRGCETACPSGVQYGQIIGSYKKDLATLLPPASSATALQRWMLFNLTPYAFRMRLALAPMRLLQGIGLGSVIRGLGRFLPRSLRLMQEIVPDLEPHYGRLPEVLEPIGPRRARVALFLGCAADAFFPKTNLATARVLQQNGCEVWIPRTQVCCGALHYHAGLVDPARRFAEANCASFGAKLDNIDAIINNAGGCGPVLKDYGHLLENSSEAARAAVFAKKVRDISEFLVELGPVKPTHALPLKATYHDACGLSHAQKIRQPPRKLLEMIPGLEVVALQEGELCCGAAGSYNVTQPAMAHDLGARKAQNILATGAQAVFAGNVGCLLQIGRHLREQRPDIWVAHPIDALWASYSGEMPDPKLRSALLPR